MTLYVDSPENGIKNSDDNIQYHSRHSEYPSTYGSSYCKNIGFDSIAHWFSTNAFIRFTCDFQIGSLLHIS